MTRARTVAWWTVPSLLCLLLHWQGFTAWFRADDFAWLSNFNRIHSFHDLLVILFLPQAQGTIRPLSERAFFVIGYGLFGLDSLPFRIVIFATQFAALALAALVGAKLTGSRAAGFCAVLLWTVNSTTVQPLAWACVYNEVMCAFFLLLAFYFLLRHIEASDGNPGGARPYKTRDETRYKSRYKNRYKIWEWVVFLLGFGALEVNVVYPVLAAAYTLLCARKFFRGTLPMLAVSIGYTIMHTLVAPPATTGVYVMHFGPSILRTLAIYWTWSIGPVFLPTSRHIRLWMLLAGVAVISVGLLVFFALRLRLGQRAVLFCVAWYLVTLAPMLPLRDHLTEYYPYIPVIGLAWLGGWGLVEAWRRGAGSRLAAIGLAALYAALMLPRTVTASEWNHHLTIRSRDLVEGVARASELHPGEAILLYRADDEQFLNAIREKPFPLIGLNSVYLAPGSEKQIAEPADSARVEDFILAPDIAARALDLGKLQVYDVRGSVLRNITTDYGDTLAESGLPLRISAGEPLTAYLLGPEWYAIDVDHRWMPKRVTLRIGAPAEPGKKLYLSGHSPDALGAVQVTVTVDGAPLPPQTVRPGPFEAVFPLPNSVVGKREMLVAVEVSRTFRPPEDPRELGLSFGVFEVR
jgi:hypothetical protein